MPADLLTARTFFSNAACPGALSGDAYSEFLHRVETALCETALDIRAEAEPDPVTAIHVARQQYAIQVLSSPTDAARRMLPGLVIAANEAGLLSEAGVIDATDAQIRAKVVDLVNAYSGYVPALP